MAVLPSSAVSRKSTALGRVSLARREIRSTRVSEVLGAFARFRVHSDEPGGEREERGPARRRGAPTGGRAPGLFGGSRRGCAGWVLHSIRGNVNVSEERALDGLVVADVMLREPRTLPGDARVHEVRAQLANPKMQMVLLADHRRFVGAITAIPSNAPDQDPAVAYADPNPETISADAPSGVAFEQAFASPHRRVIVLDDAGALLGLLCLNASRTRFCQTTS